MWVLVVGTAVLLARGLDEPLGGGAVPDESRPVAGAVADPPSAGAGGPAEGKLPPLALIPDGPPPAAVRGLSPGEQVEALRREAGLTAEPELLVQLGALYQRLEDPVSARVAFRDALRIAPDTEAALVGLAVNPAVDEPGGLPEARSELAALARANPQSQLVAFNQGWVALYAQDPATARDSWMRAVALDPDTALGVSAGRLLEVTGDPAGTGDP